MVEKTQSSDNTASILTFVLLIFAYPVGIIVMWLWTKWAKWVKILVTLPVILIVLFGILVGFASTVNVDGQIKKAECTKQCANSQLKETCMNQCLGNLNVTPNYQPSPTP